MKRDTTLSETVSALRDVLLITDINPLRVRGSFIFLVKSLNTVIDFCSVRLYLHFMIVIYINAVLISCTLNNRYYT